MLLASALIHFCLAGRMHVLGVLASRVRHGQYPVTGSILPPVVHAHIFCVFRPARPGTTRVVAHLWALQHQACS